jgi:hypothetical protein
MGASVASTVAYLCTDALLIGQLLRLSAGSRFARPVEVAS